MSIQERETLTIAQRISLGLLGSSLILFTMLAPIDPLQGFVLLPLIATYPIFAAIYGYDPIMEFLIAVMCRIWDRFPYRINGYRVLVHVK